MNKDCSLCVIKNNKEKVLSLHFPEDGRLERSFNFIAGKMWRNYLIRGEILA